jgi:hypothetical protein
LADSKVDIVPREVGSRPIHQGGSDNSPRARILSHNPFCGQLTGTIYRKRRRQVILFVQVIRRHKPIKDKVRRNQYEMSLRSISGKGIYEVLGGSNIIFPTEGGIFLAGIYEGHGGDVSDGIGPSPTHQGYYLIRLGQICCLIGIRCALSGGTPRS